MIASRARYPALTGLSVADAMHPGLISCSLDSPLRTVAGMMGTHRVHAVLVTARGEHAPPTGRPWGIISDADLLRAAETADFDEQPARTIATAPVVTIDTDDELADAATVMAARKVSHLIVLEPCTERPIGVLSTLDLARALAGFPERHPARAQVPPRVDRRTSS